MRIGQSQFLALHACAHNRTARAAVHSHLSEALENWVSGSRVSPIWRLDADSSAAAPAAIANTRLLFVGPVSPSLLCSEVQGIRDNAGITVWLTLGSFNVVLAEGQGGEVVTACQAWAEQSMLPWEEWTLGPSSEVTGTRHFCPPPADIQKALDRLAHVASDQYEESLGYLISEYVALCASALARSASSMPDVHDTLRSVNEMMLEIIESRQSMEAIDVQTSLVAMNAALSRFSSQAFAGAPPIITTECHFWIHSLLGTGIANLALFRTVEFVRQTLGHAQIAERIASLASKTDNVPSLEGLRDTERLAREDIIGKAPVAPEFQLPVAPVVTYFSGRDGFSSHLKTVSAPLSTISECNSYRSNLLTVTHEISHIFVEGVLAHIYPDADDTESLKKGIALTRPDAQANTWLDALRQLVYEALIAMEQAEKREDLYSRGISEELLLKVALRWRKEAQEILVHTFDYLYFYGADRDFYIKSIWDSWCSIPSIGDRVPKYVMRTLCAISPHLLAMRAPDRAEEARATVIGALEELRREGGLVHNYVDQAIEFLTNNWSDGRGGGAITEYNGRLDLVRIVKGFLYSDTLAAAVGGDSHIHGAAGYLKKKKTIDLSPIGNPLRFLKESLSKSPDQAESLWALTNIAFNTRTGPRND